jgi:dTDP-4-dehydrorhamnose reductase
MLGLDLADATACRQAVEMHQLDWVLNAGAYTAVDKAEGEPVFAEAVNAQAPQAFAEVLRDQGGRLLQLSTDFVFNGEQGRPYRPCDTRSPLGVYGASKARGEDAVNEILSAHPFQALEPKAVVSSAPATPGLRPQGISTTPEDAN